MRRWEREEWGEGEGERIGMLWLAKPEGANAEVRLVSDRGAGEGDRRVDVPRKRDEDKRQGDEEGEERHEEHHLLACRSEQRERSGQRTLSTKLLSANASLSPDPQRNAIF